MTFSCRALHFDKPLLRFLGGKKVEGVGAGFVHNLPASTLVEFACDTHCVQLYCFALGLRQAKPLTAGTRCGAS